MDVTQWPDERLAGQRLMVGFEGLHFSPGLERLVAGLGVGGLILFKRNVESPEQLARLTRAAQAAARDAGGPPLFIAVDQEGGRVARLGPPFTQFPNAPPIAGEAEAERFAAVTAAELASVGINMDLAPVLDVAPRGIGSVMAERAFGADPALVARLGALVIEGLQSRGIMAVAKHFPGIGRTTLDSHRDLPRLDAGRSALEAFDLIPFRAAIAKGVAGVMLSHVLYTGLDPEWPASLSVRIARGLLRRRLGFDGLALTDDLEMGAVERRCRFATAVRRALRADVDLLLVCRSAEKILRAHALMAREIGGAEKRRQRAEEAARRILAAKRRFIAAAWGRGG